jgi:hypothetical protein
VRRRKREKKTGQNDLSSPAGRRRIPKENSGDTIFNSEKKTGRNVRTIYPVRPARKLCPFASTVGPRRSYFDMASRRERWRPPRAPETRER